MDTKILKMGGPGGWKGRAGGAIHSEKFENHKNSTHTKIKFYVTFINLFFLWRILKFLEIWEGGRKGGRPGVGGIYFFDIFLYYFINVMIKTLYIISFSGCLRHIFYT